jgi:type I restriction enzyme S subunit
MSENEKNVPKRRFKEFEDAEAWEQRKLGELGSVVMNRRIFKEQTSDEGDVPFYKIGTFGSQPDAFISRELFEEYKSKYPYPEKGDILISASGSIGRTVEYIGKDEYFQDSNIVWLQHDDQVINSFLKQFYSVVKWSGLEGSTIKRLYNKNILDTPISLPKPKEQKTIGHFFNQLDNLITLHQRKLEKMKALKKAYLTEMFPAEGERKPKLRFAGFTDDWEQRKFDEEVEFYSGLTYSPNDVSDNGTFVLRSSNVKNGEIVDADNVYVNSEVVNSSNVKEGDIIVVVRNGSRSLIGKHAQIKRKMDKTVIGAFMTGIRSNQSSFINALMDTQQFSGEVEKNLGATINQITNGMFREMRFMFPDIQEQNQIGNFFNNLGNLITLHQRKLEKLQNTKKAYLNEMFI